MQTIKRTRHIKRDFCYETPMAREEITMVYKAWENGKQSIVTHFPAGIDNESHVAWFSDIDRARKYWENQQRNIINTLGFSVKRTIKL